MAAETFTYTHMYVNIYIYIYTHAQKPPQGRKCLWAYVMVQACTGCRLKSKQICKGYVYMHVNMQKLVHAC